MLTSYKQACWMLGASETDSPTLARWLRRFVFKCVAEMHNQSGLADQFVEDMVHEPLPEDSVAFRQEAILVAQEAPFQDMDWQENDNGGHRDRGRIAPDIAKNTRRCVHASQISEGDRAVARLFASVRQKGHRRQGACAVL